MVLYRIHKGLARLSGSEYFVRSRIVALLRFEKNDNKQVVSTVRSILIYGTVRVEDNNFGLRVVPIWAPNLNDSTPEIVFPRLK